ncbi:MAG: M1 family aminopeptidase [Bacteroidales bacterium]
MKISNVKLQFIQKSIPVLLVFIFFSCIVFPQIPVESKGSWQCYQNKIHHKDFLPDKSTNSPKHSFDVLKYTLDLDLYNCYSYPYPHSFYGQEIVRFKINTALNSIQLNAVNMSMDIDSVGMSGISYTHNNDILTINLDQTYNSGEITDVKIYYHHLNVSDNAFYTGNGIVFTDCEPEGARKWFPCWDRPSDKALLDLTAKVPDNVLLGSNGRLQDSIHIADTIWYNWVSRDPVATYLTVITSKVNYNLDIVYWPMISDPSVKVPIRFYYNTGENPTPIENIIVDMTNFYSTIFCEHPFEKNGFATIDTLFPWGGMENQTLTSLCSGCWGEYLTAHEFAHQWFGDMITCGTWSDIWLNEGFATYIEALWSEHKYGYTQYKNRIDYDADTYLTDNPGWEIANPNWAVTTPPLFELFDYAVTYCKGACVLHMFRYTVGDSLFFESLKQYASDTVDFKYKSAVIPDFITKVNTVCGQNLDWFFNEWLHYPNHPVYANVYNIVNNYNGTWAVDFTANQVQTNAGFFKMPIELKILFLNGSDTIVKVINDQNNQWFQFLFNKQPTAIIFDPNNNIVLKEGTTVGINEYDSDNPSLILYQNNPNPFSDNTQIVFELPTGAPVKIAVYNVYGKLISVIADKTMNAGKHEIEFSSSSLSQGIYFYSVESGKYKQIRKMVVIK